MSHANGSAHENGGFAGGRNGSARAYSDLGKGDPPASRRNGLLTAGSSSLEREQRESRSIVSRLFGRLFGGGGARRTSGHLPSYTKRDDGDSLTNRAPRGSLYADGPLVGGGGRRASFASLGFTGLLRALVLRPFYVLGRRGPMLPLFILFVFAFYFFAYSTSPSTQSVKRRVQGAVGPYVPQRAADAINWGSRKQATWNLRDALRMRGDKGPNVKGGDAMNARNKKKGKSQELAQLPEQERKDGRIVIEAGKPHPIPALMKRAKERWEQLKAKQSKTFAEAVAEYERRYGRKPPRGFDQWYAFAKAHNVLLIDEFDLINRDLHLFRAFRPPILRKRLKHLQDTFDQLWTIRIKNGKALREGPLGHHARAAGVVNLMERFVHLLPDMEIVYNGHDGARIAVSGEERARLEGLADRGEYDDDDEPPFEEKDKGPFPHWGYPVLCPPGSAVRDEGFEYGWAPKDSTGFEMPPLIEGSAGSLVENFSSYMDVCNAPHYRHFHCTTSWVYSHHPQPVMPLFTPGVQTTFGDIYTLIVEQLDLESPHDPTWEERAFTSLVWRGQTSGPLWEKTTPWRTTQRARLHLLSHQEDGERTILVTDDDGIVQAKTVPNYRLNPLFLDTGMIGPAVQCVEEDGTCDEMFDVFEGYDKRMSFDRASLYKYALDVDGNSWSGRFRRLMMSNAAVVKATVFPEFWTDWAIPWLHFIPIQVDYSDMWDVLAFFRGGLEGEGAHDELGKEIALAGKEWVRQCYRWVDLEAYQFRLMLEYARLITDETSPGSKDFNGDVTKEPIWEGSIKTN